MKFRLTAKAFFTRYRFVWWAALIYTAALALPASHVLRFTNLGASVFKTHPLLFAGIYYALSYLAAAAFLFLLALNRRVFFIGLFPVLLIAALARHYCTAYDIVVDESAIALVAEKTINHARDFAQPRELIWPLFIALGITALLTVLYRRMPLQVEHRPRIALLWSILFIATLPLWSEIQFAPGAFLQGTATYTYGKVELALITRQRPESFDGTFRFKPGTSAPEQLQVVIVIGESARSVNFGILGYGRDTTPRLAQEKNLHVFSQVRECSHISIHAAPCILTGLYDEDLAKQYPRPSLVDAFNALGFKTYWLSAYSPGNDTAVFPHAAPYRRYLRQANKPFHIEGAYDGDLVPLLSDAMQDCGNANCAYVLYTIGSHWQFDMRYPDAFRRFTPTFDWKRPTHEGFVNSYDNTILYTDAFLSDLIGLMRGKQAILAYTPDNTYALGENGHYMNVHPRLLGQTPPAMPMLFWFSDSYLQQSSDWFATAQTADYQQPLGTDALFHTLLDCLGVESESYLSPEKSLCRK